MAVLIVTIPGDQHAHAVRLAIQHLGHECEMFYPTDFAGGADWSFDPGCDELEYNFRGNSGLISFRKYDAVWMRRPAGLVPRENLTDIRERAAAEADSATLVSSILKTIERGRFTASSLEATGACSDKPYQFRVARAIGLPMPATLVSNCKEKVLAFHDRYDGRVIYKSLRPMVWPGRPVHSGQATNVTLPTMRVSAEMLATSDLASAPAIFQELIAKRAELRVTIFGNTLIAVEKQFGDRSVDSLHVDWRLMHSGAIYRRHELPIAIADKCRELTRELGLVMGVIDLIVDNQGNYYFLEINAQGQFLIGDHNCADVNHLEAIAEFLISRDSDFEYSGRNRINLSLFGAALHARSWKAKEEEDHFGDMHAYRYALVTYPLFDWDANRKVVPYGEWSGKVSQLESAGSGAVKAEL